MWPLGLIAMAAAALLTSGPSEVAAAPLCNVQQRGVPFCVCNNRNATDMSFTTLLITPIQPNAIISFGLGGYVDMLWDSSSGNSGIDVTLYVDGVPQTRVFYPLNGGEIGFSSPTQGPGRVDFSVGTGPWDRIGTDELFFELIFYAPFSGDQLTCIRTDVFTPTLNGPARSLTSPGPSSP